MLLNYIFTVREKGTNEGYILDEFRSATLDNALEVCKLKCETLGLDYYNCEIRVKQRIIKKKKRPSQLSEGLFLNYLIS